MENSVSDFFDFFTCPILNSPYEIPTRHWELDEVTKQPTRRIAERRRNADFYTPIPKPRKQKSDPRQKNIFDGVDEISTDEQEYSVTAIIDQIREYVGAWRKIPDPSKWGVTPETARLLQHWRHYDFSGIRPFFCQVEAAETLIWLTEAAPNMRDCKFILEHLKNANAEANPELSRIALKLATGAGKTTVMTMLIAWQTINAIRHPQSRRCTRGFLIVTPGITIKDRLMPKN
jgi:type III restriction enzyme